MEIAQPSQDRRLVSIILGADTFEGLRAVRSDEVGAAFKRSKEGFAEYIGKIASRVLDKFNSEDLPDRLCLEIADFLSSEKSATDLVVYYVGHGGSLALPDRSEYFLALRQTTDDEKYIDGLRASQFAQVINKNAAGLRAVIILDCCYSARAAPYFCGGDPNPPSQIRRTPFGVSVFAAAAPEAEAVVPAGEKYTMFSGCLLEVLTSGIAKGGEFLSLREIAAEVRVIIEQQYASDPISPQLHSPRQRYGDVADYPLFPNAAYQLPHLREARREQDFNVAQKSAPTDVLNLFVASAGLGAPAGMGVLTCTVIDDPSRVRVAIGLARRRAVKSPILDLDPAAENRLLETGFDYMVDDPDLCAIFLESIGPLTYEAYSCCAENTYFEGAGEDEIYRELFGRLLYDRIKRHRTRKITIWLPNQRGRILGPLQDVVVSCVHGIDTTSRARVLQVPVLRIADGLEGCLELTDYVAAIIRGRLGSAGSQTPEARRYRAVESKVRLIRRLDTGDYFSRHHPLPN